MLYIVSSVDEIGKVEDEVEPEGGFHPEFTHQVFSDNETVYGYSGLKIRLLYVPWSMFALVETIYDSKTPDADDIPALIGQFLPADSWTTSMSEFTAHITAGPKVNASPPGTSVGSYTRGDDEFEIFHSTFADADCKNWHDRLQLFVLWMIDGASFVDRTDARWELFVAYRKGKDADGKRFHAPIGYCTVYPFFAYPEKRRLRVSQFLIFPPFQGGGHGRALLRHIYTHAVADETIAQVTVEGPAPSFLLLRDVLDTQRIWDAGVMYPKSLPPPLQDGSTPGNKAPPENVKELEWTPELVESVMAKLKIPKHQVRRLYEILRLALVIHEAASKAGGEEEGETVGYRDYRLEVKRRLYRRNAEDFKDDPDLQKAVLSQAFSSLEEQYMGALKALKLI